MQAACILASRHPSKHIMGQAPQYADDPRSHVASTPTLGITWAW